MYKWVKYEKQFGDTVKRWELRLLHMQPPAARNGSTSVVCKEGNSALLDPFVGYVTYVMRIVKARIHVSE